MLGGQNSTVPWGKNLVLYFHLECAMLYKSVMLLIVINQRESLIKSTSGNLCKMVYETDALPTALTRHLVRWFITTLFFIEQTWKEPQSSIIEEEIVAYSCIRILHRTKLITTMQNN